MSDRNDDRARLEDAATMLERFAESMGVNGADHWEREAKASAAYLRTLARGSTELETMGVMHGLVQWNRKQFPLRIAAGYEYAVAQEAMRLVGNRALIARATTSLGKDAG